MRKIKVLNGVFAVSAGAVVGLSAAQAAPRLHNIEPVKNGDAVVPDTFRAKAPLQFKTGEELAVSEVAKGQLDQVQFLDEPAAEESAAGEGGKSKPGLFNRKGK